MGVSENLGYLILGSLYSGSYYLGYYIKVPIFGNSQVGEPLAALRTEPDAREFQVHLGYEKGRATAEHQKESRAGRLGTGDAGFPKDPCTRIVDALAPKYQYRDYFKA